MTLFANAQQYHAAGLSVLPARRKEKRPGFPSWKEFQKQLPTATHVAACFAHKQDALCVICGKVSGNLEVLDFDNHGEHFDAWLTAIPKYFSGALSPRVINNGLSARCMVIEAGKRGHGQKPKPIIVPDNIIRSVEVYKSYSGSSGNLTSERPVPMVIPATPEADACLEKLNEKYDLIYDEFEAKAVTTAMTFWARSFEKVCKLSMLYAVSANPINPVISIEALDWAEAFVNHLTRQMLFMVNAYSFENQFDEVCRNLVGIIRKRKGSVRHWKLLKDSRLSSEMFEKVIATLIDNRTIEAFDGPNNRRKHTNPPPARVLRAKKASFGRRKESGC